MSTLDINKMENEEEKSPDKKQIEAEEKEMMLKTEAENNEINAESKEAEGLVKAALSADVIEQGREVKPKFIPIGAIKMPGFFTRNSEKAKVCILLLNQFILKLLKFASFIWISQQHSFAKYELT